MPPPSTARAWLDRFAGEFPDADYVAIGFDGTSQNADDLAWFADHGFTVEADIVMTATAVHPPSRVNIDAVHRTLDSDDDWAQSIELRMLCKDLDLDPDPYRAFVTAKAKTNQELVAAGRGQWFGSFVEDTLVARMGLIVAEPGTARFQSVETAPNHRRRGLAGTLVHQASQHGFQELGAHTLVMIAEPDYFAIDLYKSVGFIPTETQLQVEHRPPA